MTFREKSILEIGETTSHTHKYIHIERKKEIARERRAKIVRKAIRNRPD